jgi:hypothetical protein
LDWLGKRLLIKQLDDWTRVSVKLIQRMGSFGGIKNKEDLVNILKQAYPSHAWKTEKWKCWPLKASQRILVAIVREIFPDSGKITGTLQK